MDTKILKCIEGGLAQGNKVKFDAPVSAETIAEIFGGKVWRSKDGRVTNVYLKPVNGIEKIWFNVNGDEMTLRCDMSVSFKDLLAAARKLADAVAEKINRELVFAVAEAEAAAEAAEGEKMDAAAVAVARKIANNVPVTDAELVAGGFEYVGSRDGIVRYELPAWFAGVKDVTVYLKDGLVVEYDATASETNQIAAFLARFVETPTPPTGGGDGATPQSEVAETSASASAESAPAPTGQVAETPAASTEGGGDEGEAAAEAEKSKSETKPAHADDKDFFSMVVFTETKTDGSIDGSIDYVGKMTVSPFISGETVESSRFIEVSGSALTFFCVEFRHCLFDSVFFEKCVFDGCKFIDCTLTGKFDEGLFINCTFKNCYIEKIEFAQCNMYMVVFKRCKIVTSAFGNLVCKELVFENTELDEVQATRRSLEKPFEILADGCVIWKCSPELAEAGKGKSAITSGATKMATIDTK